jgi:hypothetical protein
VSFLLFTTVFIVYHPTFPVRMRSKVVSAEIQEDFRI